MQGLQYTLLRIRTERTKEAIWNPPVIAQQELIIRDQEKIFAFDIGETK